MLVRRSSPANQWSHIMSYTSTIKERELAKLRVLRNEFAERAEADRRRSVSIRRAELAEQKQEMEWAQITRQTLPLRSKGGAR
jgi:hypothetical protein